MSVRVGETQLLCDNDTVINLEYVTPVATQIKTYTFECPSDVESVYGDIVVYFEQTTSKAIYFGGLTVYGDSEEEEETQQEAGLEYSDSAVTFDTDDTAEGNTLTLPTLSNPNKLTVTYESSNTALATVTDDGTVSVVSGVTGTATITASSAETDEYKAGSASYTITVYTAYTFNFQAYDYGMTVFSSGSSYESSVSSITGKNDVTADFTGNYRMWQGTSSTDFRVYKNATMTLSAPAGMVITGITFSGSSVSNLSPDNGTLASSKWTGAAKSIVFTASGTATIYYISITLSELVDAEDAIAISLSEGYATLYKDVTFVMPEGLVGTTVTETEDSELVTAWEYEADDVVPACTALLLKGSVQDYSYQYVKDYTGTAPTDNLLYGSTTATTTVGPNDSGSYYFYKLTYKSGANLGFYWGATDGGSFTSQAGKAYLALPQANASSLLRGFVLGGGDEEETTRLNPDVLSEGSNASTVVYNLSGQRVESMTKGLYIVNGKKLVK